MPVTLTIKQVPERLAEGLRRRATANRRSQQQELLLMLERAVGDTVSYGVAKPAHAVHHTGAPEPGRSGRKGRPGKSAPSPQPAGKLGIDALWQRAREFGGGMPAESAALVRADRDARQR